MRALALVVTCIAACSDHYGAYLVADGHNQIQFDHVEFFFGREVGGDVPTSPGHVNPSTGSAMVAERLFADSDRFAADGLVSRLTYYVPDRQPSSTLGDYVAVVAFAGERPVGIGELFDFNVETGRAAFVYQIDLVDFTTQDAELWGRPHADCLRWSRPRTDRPTTTAVVRPGDTDCDSFLDGGVANTDCSPLAYCDGSGTASCDSDLPCLAADGVACQVGTCKNKDGEPRSCVATMCASDLLCSQCDLSKPYNDVLSCALLSPTSHGADAPVGVHGDFTLCTEPTVLSVVLPVPCTNPTILDERDYQPGDPFTYSIAGTTSNACKVTITPGMPGAAFESIPHFLIAIDGPTPPLRLAFVMGLSALPGCPGAVDVPFNADFGTCR